MKSSENILLTPEQVAARLGVSIQTLAVWCCAKRYPLTYVKVGSRVRYRLRDLEQFITRRTERAEPAGA